MSCPSIDSGAKRTPSSMPVSIILTMSRRTSVILSRSSAMARFSARTSSARFSISAARAISGVRSKPKASSISPPCPRRAKRLPFGEVAPDDQPRLDERGEMPAQRRRRHAMGADRELPVRREHHDAGAGESLAPPSLASRLGQRQRGFLMEAQQARAGPTAPGR